MDVSIRVADLRASRGPAWLGESFRLFRRAPMQWIGLCAGWIAITLALILLPLVGGVVANVLQPVFFASFAIAAYRQSAGERITMNDLFSGFRRNWKALTFVGAILLVAQIAIFALMALMGLPILPEGEGPISMSEYVQMFEGKEWIIAIGFLLTVVVKGALWFVPPLIAFHGMSAGHAMRWSVYAAVENLGAMLTYGVALLGLLMLGILTWGLALLVVIPLVAISSYVGYREVFESASARSSSPP
jgi:uncharacterized membrane protein